MNKLKLHDLHQMEIEKQEQGMLKGGSICVGNPCGCFCGGGGRDSGGGSGGDDDAYSLAIMRRSQEGASK